MSYKPSHSTGSLGTSPNKAGTSQIVEVKSKFDAEFRRFSLPRKDVGAMIEFRRLLQEMHELGDIPFTLCYTDANGDLLPITNDENFLVALNHARPLLRVLLQRKGESWQEKYGYGTRPSPGRSALRIGLTSLLTGGGSGSGGVDTPMRGVGAREYDISQPEDFRLVSAVIDVDLIPTAHRRVKLCKHGQQSRPLGFYIRDGTSVRVTKSGVVKVPGIFISRLMPGGLAASTGLLAVNDEVLEVNGIDVSGKTLDQVTDMMVANAANLIVTVKPVNQPSIQRNVQGRVSGASEHSRASSSLYETPSDAEEDEVKVYSTKNTK